MVRYEKYVGTGNDFVLIRTEDAPADLQGFVRGICDRRQGVGADGVLAASFSGGLPVMEYWNADGSAAAFCGNGLRCFAVWAARQRGARQGWLSVKTAAGVRRVRVDGEQATVEMGRPRFLPCPALKRPDGCEKMLLVQMNVPHLVLLFGANPLPDVPRLGPALEHDPAFAQGVNVDFVRRQKTGYEVLTWERGCGQTPACGTGACAAAAACGLSAGSRLQISTNGGMLLVTSDAKGLLWLTGAARRTCVGEYEPAPRE